MLFVKISRWNLYTLQPTKREKYYIYIRAISHCFSLSLHVQKSIEAPFENLSSSSTRKRDAMTFVDCGVYLFPLCVCECVCVPLSPPHSGARERRRKKFMEDGRRSTDINARAGLRHSHVQWIKHRLQREFTQQQREKERAGALFIDYWISDRRFYTLIHSRDHQRGRWGQPFIGPNKSSQSWERERSSRDDYHKGDGRLLSTAFRWLSNRPRRCYFIAPPICYSCQLADVSRRAAAEGIPLVVATALIFTLNVYVSARAVFYRVLM